MNINRCAPGKYDSANNTCFGQEQLIEMASAYNRYLVKAKLNPNRVNLPNADLINLNNKLNKPYLLMELKKRFDHICKGDELCLTQQSFMNEIVREMRDDIVNNTFRPDGPVEAKDWLSTQHINNIMKQYEPIYPDFKFLGAVPLDCDIHAFCPLHRIDMDKYLSNRISKLGIVFNMDKFGDPGSHWVSMYIDIANGEIYYCDSNGKKPIDNMNTVISQFLDYYKKKTGKNAIYKYNNKSYQKDKSECGVYSCNFIIRKLAGESFDDIVDNPLSFQEINSCRNVYFRNKPSEFKPHSNCDPR